LGFPRLLDSLFCGQMLWRRDGCGLRGRTCICGERAAQRRGGVGVETSCGSGGEGVWECFAGCCVLVEARNFCKVAVCPQSRDLENVNLPRRDEVSRESGITVQAVRRIAREIKSYLNSWYTFVETKHKLHFLAYKQCCFRSSRQGISLLRRSFYK
jgi:hypothetical protein